MEGMMSEDQFSFRWGIPWLDRGFVQIPTSFFRAYAQAGVTRSEFLFVLHLATYHFESRGGESRPSLARIAEEMGITQRGVRKLRASLEEKGLLRVQAVPGRPSVYSFEEFAKRLVMGKSTPELSDTPEPQFLPPRNPSSGVPRNPSSSEEEEDKKKKQQQGSPGVVFLSAAQERARAALLKVGVNEQAIGGLLQEYGTDRIVEVVEAVEDGRDVRNAGAWVVRCLERGYDLGVTKAGKVYHGRLVVSAGNCMYRKNPQLGPCVAEDPERVAWMMCTECVRGAKKSALEGDGQELLF